MRMYAHVARMSTSVPRLALKEFTMPAMSPTMEQGNLGQWKVKEGDKFAAGDVLLEIETDKAMMDVEAQDDGVMARIVVRTFNTQLTDRRRRVPKTFLSIR